MIFTRFFLLFSELIIYIPIFSEKESLSEDIIENSVNIFDNSSEFDKFGIKKIYPTAENGFEWFLNMSSAELDPYLFNYKKISKNSDSL